MLRRLALLSMIAAMAACGTSDGSQVPADDAGTQTTPDSADSAVTTDGTAATPFAMPEVWGPKALADSNPDPNVVEVTLEAAPHTTTIESAELAMLAYNGQQSGPLLQAKVGDEIIVHFTNKLDEPTTIHWHGLRISDQMDGNPRIQNPVEPGGTFSYRFVAKEAGTFWYHPHVRSNEQVERGLYGPIVIHDPQDPGFDAERMLVLDDILIDFKGNTLPPFIASHPEIMHGRHGNRVLTNGQPSHTVKDAVAQGSVERWRIVNTANARTMEIGLAGATFRVLGTDGGRLATPYTTKRLLVPVGQRYDIEVTYAQAGEAQLILYAPALDANNQVVEVEVPLFTAAVSAGTQAAHGVRWPAGDELIPERKAGREVTLEFDAVEAPGTPTGVAWRINGKSNSMEPLFTFKQGDTVKMKLANKLGPEHPFHLHGQFFRIVPNGQAWTEQPGLKDTVLVPGMQTVEIVAYMDNPGRWMAHCHILTHAELGMMGELVVEPAP